MKVLKTFLATTMMVALNMAFVPLGAMATAAPRPAVWAKYCQAISGAYTDSEALTYGAALSQVRRFAAAQSRDVTYLVAASKAAPTPGVRETTREWASAVQVSVRQKNRIIEILTGPDPTSAMHVRALRAAFKTLGADQRKLTRERRGHLFDVLHVHRPSESDQRCRVHASGTFDARRHLERESLCRGDRQAVRHRRQPRRRELDLFVQWFSWCQV